MKCLWNLLEGRTRQRLRVRAFSVLFTFLSMGDILDLPQALSHLTVSRNTLHFNNNRRILPSVGALDLTTRDINLSDSGDRLSSSNVRVPGFKEEEEEVNWLHRVPHDKLLHALADSKLSQSREEEKEDEQEEESIEISRTVEPQVLQRLESKFLKLFGMSKRPPKTVEKKLKVPKYLLDLYQKQNGDETLMPTTNLNLPGRNTRTANTVRTFYVEEPGLTSSLGGDDDDNHLHFNLDSIPDSEQVTGAELRVPFILRKEDLSSSDDDDQVLSVKILLHDIIKKKTHPLSKKPKQFHLTQPITQPIDSKTVNLSKRRNGTTTTFYLTFDVFPAVSRWGKNRKINHGLLLEIVYIGQNGVPIIPPTKQDTGKVNGKKRHNVRVKRDLAISSSSSNNQGDDDDSGKSAAQGTEVGAVAAVIPTQNESKKSSPTTQPIVLFTYSDDNRTGRKTRDAKTISRQYRAAQQNQQQRRRKNHRNKNKRRNLCARHNMFVDFTDVGWNDWIVAPPGAHFFHCSGECPFPMAENLNATNHAVIQALVNSMNPGLVPPPCCVPTKYSSLSLLYTDSSDKIVLKNYNEMVVDSCGCS